MKVVVYKMRCLWVQKQVPNWSNFLQEVCFHTFILQAKPIGGQEKVVEIVEAKVGHHKYNRGRIVQGNNYFPAFNFVILL